MIRSRNCYSCNYYKDGYCENLELKPCYPQKGCEDFSSVKGNKESIPYLMHNEMNIPISECQKAYDVAIDYLRSQGKLNG
jgi:hypothetical protein